MPSLEEVELKFQLTEAALDQLRWEVFADAPPRTLRSLYFDTADRALAGRGLALRLRHDGGGWRQTIKGPGDVARYEDEVAVPGPAVDAERLRRAPGGEDPPAAFSPVFEVRVERRTADIRHGGAEIELALDEGAVSAGPAQQAIRELELELNSGELPDLFGAARQLCARPGVRLSLASKAERGYRLADGAAGEPPRFQPPRLQPETPVRAAFQSLALAALAQLCSAVERVAGEGSREGVHQARVALRRLRVLIGAFAPALADDGLEPTRAGLKRMTELFADARSLDVFVDDLAEAPPDVDGAAALDGAARAARTAAYARLRTQVGSEEVGAGLLALAQWILCGAWTRDPALAEAGDRPLGSLASTLLVRRRKRMRKRGRRLDWSDARGRHKLRIQAKKMHYLLDALAPSQTGSGAYRRLKRLQTELGDLNDIATAPETASLVLRSSTSLPAAFAAGQRVGERQAGSARLIPRARRALRRWARAPAIGSDFA